MQTTPKLLTEGNKKEIIIYSLTGRTYEKVYTRGGCYQFITLRKFKQYHKIEVDYSLKTITINDKLFTTFYASGYTYKKGKGNTIGCSDFISLVEHIKESTQRKSPFSISTFQILKNISKSVNCIY